MRFLKQTLLVLSIMAVLFTGCSKDDDNNNFKLGDKNGILLVTFGSSYVAPQSTFNTIEEATKAAFPGEEVRWAYTADQVINTLRKGEGQVDPKDGKNLQKDLDNPEAALLKMIIDGYSKITLQSLHVIPGAEYDDLVDIVEKVKKQYPGLQCSIGKPLLNASDDVKEVAKILVNKFKTQNENGTPVLFMGHGSHFHPNHSRYVDLQAEFKTLAPKFFVGVVEDNHNADKKQEAPVIGGILPKLAKLTPKPKNVIITPLMSIVGDHSENDMNGESPAGTPVEEMSWRDRLVKEGYTVKSELKGLGDYPELTAIWIKHLKEAKIK